MIAIIVSGRLNCFCRDLAFPMTLTSRRRVLRWTLRSFDLRSSASPSTPFSGSPFDEYNVVLAVYVLLSLLMAIRSFLILKKALTCRLPVSNQGVGLFSGHASGIHTYEGVCILRAFALGSAHCLRSVLSTLSFDLRPHKILSPPARKRDVVCTCSSDANEHTCNTVLARKIYRSRVGAYDPERH